MTSLRLALHGGIALITALAGVPAAAPAQTAEQQRLIEINKRAEALKSQRKIPEAIAAYKEAIELAPTALGPTAASTGNLMINLAELLAEQGDFASAVPWYEKALKIREIRWDEDSEEAAEVRNNLAIALVKTRQFARAEALYRFTLRCKEDRFGPDEPEVALVHNNLGVLYLNQGEPRKAREHLERALAIWEKRQGPDHPNTATALGNLAQFYREFGQPQRAEPLARRVVKIRKAQKPTADSDLPIAYNNLAAILHDLGQGADALALHRKALTLWEKKHGPNHPILASALANYAALQTGIGEWQDSEQMLLRSLEIDTRAGAESLDTAHILNNLGHLYDRQRRYPEAIKAYRRCLQIRQARLGPQHVDIALTLNNLAAAYQGLGALGEAEPLYEQCLKMRRALLGHDHPDVARVLGNLATVALERADVAQALTLTRQQYAINRDRLGEHHPGLAQTRMALGALLAHEKQWDEVPALFDQSLRGRVAEVRQLFGVLSEAEQLRYLALHVESDTSMALSWAVHKREDARWCEASAGWVLNLHGLGHESLAERAVLARDNGVPQLAALSAELYAVRKQMAALAFAEVAADKEPAKTLARLVGRERDLAKQLAEATHRPNHTWVELDRVRKAMPKDAVMVLISHYRQRDLKNPFNYARARFHYAAWIVPAHGAGAIALVPLGEAEPIEQTVRAVRAALAEAPKEIRAKGEPGAEKLVRTQLHALAERIHGPLAHGLAGAGTWFVVPDGELWLVPWGALPLGEKQYVIDRHEVQFLNSGRDLLRPRPALSNSTAYVFANPDFDLTYGEARQAAVVARKEADNRARSVVPALKLPKVVRLPATAAEAAAIVPKLQALTGRTPTLYEDRDAQEIAFKRMRSPRFVVLSTHGFFMDRPANAAQEPSPYPANPLLRCGLLLASCNQRAFWPGPEEEDGVLTGLEIVGADLRGCELIVLSACETALGEVHTGEGVAGLRQAFQIAGAQAVVATLWQVADRETALLMNTFFTKLVDKERPAQALRSAQLDRIGARRREFGAAHPFFWAAFTVTGR
jgi:CHAT domain-containing protein/Tfp pilus assembly protein PilF